MTKRKYLRRLRKALGRTPEREKEELIEYYAEIIDESYERGKTTREIFATLETPEKVASDYFNANEGRMNDNPRARRYTPPRRYDDEDFGARDERYERPVRREEAPKKRSVILTILLLPLYVVGFVLALAASIVCISLLIADVCVVVAFGAAGGYALFMSFGLLPAHGTLAVTQIGAAILLFGLSVLFGLTIKPLGMGVGAFFRLLFHKKSSGGGVAPSHWVPALVTGVILLLVGGAMGGFGYYALGSDWHNLAVVGDFVEKEQIVDLSEESFSFVADNIRIDVRPLEEGEPRLVYYETEGLQLEYSVKGGVTSLKCGEWFKWGGWKESFRRGIMFSAVVSDKLHATLYLPADYAGNLSVETDNGFIAMGGFADTAFGTVTLTTDNGMISVDTLFAKELAADTDNGYISVKNVNAEAVKITTDNGAVKLKYVTAQKVSGSTHNGAIILERLQSDEVTLETSNGSISGTLVGLLDDFKIQTHVGLGSCNLKEKSEGDKSLSVSVNNGAVKLGFVS